MEIRLLKINEFDKLLKAIHDLWNPNHVYCRIPELLKYMVYDTPYRKDYCVNDEDITYYVIFDKSKVIGFCGIIPQEGNLYGKSVTGTTGTILKVDKSYKFAGIDLLNKAFSSEPAIHVGIGMNPRVMRLYRALGWHTFDDLPRWIWTNNFSELKKVFSIPDKTNISCLQNSSQSNISFDDDKFFDFIEKDKWDEFYNKEFAPKTIGIKRDYKFLQWRYIDYPFFNYRLIALKDALGNYQGLAVYRIEDILNGEYQIGRILEFIYTDIDYGIQLAAKLQTVDKNILFWDFYCLSSITSLALERCGFMRLPANETQKYIPTRFQPIDFEIMNIKGAVRFNSSTKKGISLVADQQWYLTRGDADQDRPN